MLMAIIQGHNNQQWTHELYFYRSVYWRLKQTHSNLYNHPMSKGSLIIIINYSRPYN
jgi:hypothetical protein